MANGLTRRNLVAAAGVAPLGIAQLAQADEASGPVTSDANPATDVSASTPERPAANELGTPAEVHQAAGGSHPDLTTNQGVVVADDQNALRVGARGPSLLEDFVFREKIFHFDHERIPERVVHARGYGAHGYFETTHPLAEVSRADLFQRVGEKTPVFVRFSTVAGNKGSADLARDVRGFAVKFYTKEGNWDLVATTFPCSSSRMRSSFLT